MPIILKKITLKMACCVCVTKYASFKQLHVFKLVLHTASVSLNVSKILVAQVMEKVKELGFVERCTCPPHFTLTENYFTDKTLMLVSSRS